MEERELMVEIPLERYEELLSIESRVCAASQLVEANKNIDFEVFLRVVGSYGMVKAADTIRKEHEEYYKKLKEKVDGSSISE